ncbi:2Fe-2S iron-sulfur cluster binding domain-containing protein [uncultured Azohydromonas sp.]|jgi:2-polyprenylphenol hydroxylase and related flavodoxin oxidoreductases|uniref:2Fe-2S iron-sulfur cluster binding domain-containing protein n=1 Tax=uncultured Azohydromonas sp. TaxID=487342 RepID=UPI0026111217|nr:2Fe-2S iron-sulfur cluster binding domain-containing protein [uncultured Azohydromonas sp.]
MKVQVNARNGAYQFKADPGDKVLLAGLRQLIGLPYECATGTCGTCKARLLEGEIADPWPEAPGTKGFKRRDEFLMCQCEPRSDLCVEVAGFVAPLDPGSFMPAFTSGEVVQSRLLTRDVLQLTVRTEQPLAFDAGQFALVRMPEVQGFRAWSMSSWEKCSCVANFILKRKPGGTASERLFGAPCSGMPLELFAPLGKATYHPGVERNILCVAGGSGIAGMLAILQSAAHARHFDRYDGHVFFGVRTAADVFALDRLSALVDRCGQRLRVTVALSDDVVPTGLAADYPSLEFQQGVVHAVAEKVLDGRCENLRAYLAGPPAAVDAAVRMLLRARVSTDNIRYDKFA